MDRFEEANGAPFLVGGVPYVDFIEAQVCQSLTAEFEYTDRVRLDFRDILGVETSVLEQVFRILTGKD